MLIDLYGNPSMCIELCAGNCARVSLASRLDGNNLVSNCTNLNRVSNNKQCKYHCVVLSSFG